MSYAYSHPAPFAQPQRYDFADCAGRSFIKDWQDFRRARKALFAQQAAKPAANIPPAREHIEGTTSLYDLLADEKGLWALLKKYEIFGKLYQSYDRQGRRHALSQEAPLPCYAAFAQALADKASQAHCYQYLSTLLKLMDALCAVTPQETDPALAAHIVALIDAEERLVENLKGARPS